jgi:hypothetical protein
MAATMMTTHNKSVMERQKEHVLSLFNDGKLNLLPPTNFRCAASNTRKHLQEHGLVFVGVAQNLKRQYFVCCIDRCSEICAPISVDAAWRHLSTQHGIAYMPTNPRIPTDQKPQVVGGTNPNELRLHEDNNLNVPRLFDDINADLDAGYDSNDELDGVFSTLINASTKVLSSKRRKYDDVIEKARGILVAAMEIRNLIQKQKLLEFEAAVLGSPPVSTTTLAAAARSEVTVGKKLAFELESYDGEESVSGSDMEDNHVASVPPFASRTTRKNKAAHSNQGSQPKKKIVSNLVATKSVTCASGMGEQNRKEKQCTDNDNVLSEVERKARAIYDKTKYTLFHKQGAGLGKNVIKVDRVIAADFNHKVTEVFGERNCCLANISEGQMIFIESCLDVSPLRNIEVKVEYEKFGKEKSLGVLSCPIHGNIYPTKEREMVEKESALKAFLLDGCMKMKQGEGVQPNLEKLSAKKPTKVSYLYRTLMYEETKPQDPNTLFRGEDVKKAEEAGGGRFVAYLPLCEKGLFLQIWAGKGEGRLVFIPFGKCLFLRGNMVHSGGFCRGNDFRQNGSGHFYLFLNTRRTNHCNMLKNVVSGEYRHATGIRKFTWPDTKH